MRRINILYVITKLELGGAQKQLLSLISRLDRERFTPFLFTGRVGLLVPEALSINGLNIKLSKFLERPVNPVKDLLALIEICRFIKKNRIEIVHTHSSKAGIIGRLAAKLSGVKIIIHTVHGWSFNDYQPFFYRNLYLLLEKITACLTHKLIVVSLADKQKGLSNHIAREHKSTLIPYGINYKEFSSIKPNLRQELGIASDDLVVGMVACLKAQKSPRDFIKLAFKVNQAMPKVKFLLVGDGLLHKNILKLINQFNLKNNVFLLGWRKDIPEIMSSLDVFVLTSLWEGLPIVVLEAMALGKPVVVTDTGGVREIIHEGKNGFLVPIGDIDAMSGKIVFLLKDKQLRERIGQNALGSLGGNFQIENMVINTKNLYNSCIENN